MPMKFEYIDNRNNVNFSQLQYLDFFYIKNPEDPYICLPQFSVPEQKEKGNAMRIKTKLAVYITPNAVVHKLDGKLIFSEFK
jgi:hypothetical protein